MKLKKFLFYVTISSMLVTAACKAKLSDADNAAMSKFEGDWAACGTSMTSLNDALTKAIADTKSWNEESMKGECKKDMKAKCDSLTAACKTIQDDLAAMQKTMEESKAGAEAASKEWADWSEKAKKGEVNADDFKKGMDKWNTDLAAMQAKGAEWNAKLTELTGNCKKNCDEMASCCPPKKEEKKK